MAEGDDRDRDEDEVGENPASSSGPSTSRRLPDVEALLFLPDPNCREVAKFQAKALGCEAEVNWEMYYPPTINAPSTYTFAREVHARYARIQIGRENALLGWSVFYSCLPHTLIDGWSGLLLQVDW